MLEEIKEMLEENLGEDTTAITEDSSFKEDLGIDSLDLFELVMDLETKYNIEIPTEDLEQLSTIGDVINYINAHKE